MKTHTPYHVIVNPNAGFLRNKRLDPGEPARILGDSDLVTVTQDLNHLGVTVAVKLTSGSLPICDRTWLSPPTNRTVSRRGFVSATLGA